MELVPHLWTMLGLGRSTVEVSFHPPVTLAQFGSRKALAEHCYRVIARGVTAERGRRARRQLVAQAAAARPAAATAAQ